MGEEMIWLGGRGGVTDVLPPLASGLMQSTDK